MVAALAARADPNGTWQTRASTGTARQEVSYVELEGKLYLAGGGTEHQAYDPATDSWKQLAPLPEPLDHIQGVALGGKIYYVGGLVNWPGPPSDNTYVYDPSTDSFSEGAPMPAGRDRGAGGVAAYGGKIYVAGGLARDPGDPGNYVAVPWLDVYDPAADSWTSLPDMPTARDHFQAEIVDGKLYAIGGRAGEVNAVTPVNEVFDIAASQWRTEFGPGVPFAGIPTPRGGFAIGRVGRELYLIGGEGPDGSGGSKVFDSVEAYDVDSNTWRTLASMPVGRARHGISAAVCNGGLYIAGGATSSGQDPTQSHDVFFPTTIRPCGSYHRINAGGEAIGAPASWSPDTGVGPPGSATFGTAASIDTSDPSLPAGTPAAMFRSHRFDPGPSPEMSWDLPVTPGRYEVRLYFAETYFDGPDQRKFDVSIEGALKLDDYDIYADAGANDTGVMRSFVVTSDDNLDIDFDHVLENPAVSGIEVLPLAGRDANQLRAVPGSVDFGDAKVGRVTTRSVEVTNLGAVGDPDIVIDSTTITGSGASNFSDNFDDGQGVTVAPGESTTVDVAFDPSSTGATSAALQIVHDGSGSPLTVDLTGNGVANVPVGFGKSVLADTESAFPTSLQWGPDGRLYVADGFDGIIHAYTVQRNGPNDYTVVGAQTITDISQLPNRDDDGTLDPSVTGRLITGLLVTGTPANPVVYVTSSDPRVGGIEGGGDLNLDTNSGILSKLTRDGPGWERTDLVRGLPRSEENHASNGMALDPATDTLYIAQGGNTNQGAPSTNFAELPEYALSAAVLAVKLDAPGLVAGPYDLPTLDDDSRSAAQESATDPFGGDDGKNQARLEARGAPTDSTPVSVYAPGFRNPYDIVRTAAGRLYTIDNGGNAGWGDIPAGEGPGGTCTNELQDAGETDPDALHLIAAADYYGGHPNPTRANTNNTFNANPAQSPVTSGNPIECDYRGSDTSESTALTTFPSSTNGLDEYTGSNFGGAMQGDLIAAGYALNAIYRIKLDATGTAVPAGGNTTLFSNAGSTPLDVDATGDSEPFPGTIWVADAIRDSILVFEPNDFAGGAVGACAGVYDANLDEDGDGFDNADEIDNGTNPCSAADAPPDNDGDRISDLNDPDDDNDGKPDLEDVFPVDPGNGRTTALPVELGWENGEVDSGILGLGFTGLMANGTTNYLSQFDPRNMTVRGAAGIVTIDDVPAGDAYQGSNDQQYGFQLGVDAAPSRNDRFTVHTRVLTPWAGMSPSGYQSMGVTIGDGTQDGYAKLVVSAGGGTPGLEFLEEEGGAAQVGERQPAAVVGAQAVDLYLEVDPDAATVTPSYAITAGGIAGPRTSFANLSGPVSIPPSWVGGPVGLAVGLIATSAGASPTPPFSATWAFLEVKPVVPSPAPPPPPDPGPAPSPGLVPPAPADGLTPRPPGPVLTPPVVPPGTSAPVPRAPAISKRSVAVKKGVARVKLVCSRAGARCKGTLVLTTASAVRVGGSRPTKLVVGRARYSVAAGASTTMKVKLSSQARRLLVGKKRLRVVVSATPKGATRPAAQRKVTLRQTRP